MGIFISYIKTLECVAIALITAVLLCGVGFKSVGVLQSSGYKNKKFVKWIKRKDNHMAERHTILALLCVLATCAFSLCFSFLGDGAAIVGLVPSAFFCVLYVIADKKIALRSSATFTPRFKRLYAVLFLTFAILSYIAITLLNFAAEVWGNKFFTWLRYVPFALMPVFTLPVIMLANCISALYEIPHNGKYVKRAARAVASSHIKVVGITGSFGKTSVKNILNSILSEKFKVLATAHSHNTPLGISLAVNGANLDDYDIFIAEMGARNLGDISELCEICPPDLSIITGVCGQHLESFLTFQNVVKAKSEILSYTKNKAIIADDCYDLFASCTANKQRCDCVSEVEASDKGVSFTLTLGGKSLRATSRLLGKHSAYNIGIAAMAAYELGMSPDEIVSAIKNIDYIPHRLQPIEANGVHILDDGYNSNVKGARAALEVLTYFGGKKVVVTCGLVELGILEREENFALGKALVGFDSIILVGDTLIKPVEEGYAEGGGDKEKLIKVPTLNAAQEKLKEILSEGDSVLFLNDLPDVY